MPEEENIKSSVVEKEQQVAPAKKGWPKGRKRGVMTQYHRDKISKSQILRRLISHAEGKLSPAGVAGTQQMSSTEVTAALSLLDRVLPKLTQTTIDADVRTEEVVNEIKIISVDPSGTGSDTKK